MILDGLDQDGFLRNYWQRKPLLIKGTGAAFNDPVDADELAGLACEEDIESRLVQCRDDEHWQVRHGPFDATVFATLGEKNWTLLVQAVDQEDPQVALLKRYFDFLPNWRIDDIMVSFACDGGGVGPHFDQYDVFLIQGMGQRRWQIGKRCDGNTELREGTELSLIKEFTALDEVLLEPGDVLYLPPRYAHHGKSIGNSLCYSVGFRAASCAELLQGYCHELAQGLSEDQRFEDPEPWNRAPDGSIGKSALQSGFAKIHELFQQKRHFTDYFGKLVTEPRYPDRIQSAASAQPLEELRRFLEKPDYPLVYKLNPGSRFAYFEDRGLFHLFVDGEQFRCQPSQSGLVQRLCRHLWPEALALSEFMSDEQNRLLIARLASQGSLLVEPAAND